MHAAEYLREQEAFELLRRVVNLCGAVSLFEMAVRQKPRVGLRE